jgi:hypothetical protein
MRGWRGWRRSWREWEEREAARREEIAGSCARSVRTVRAFLAEYDSIYARRQER